MVAAFPGFCLFAKCCGARPDMCGVISMSLEIRAGALGGEQGSIAKQANQDMAARGGLGNGIVALAGADFVN